MMDEVLLSQRIREGDGSVFEETFHLYHDRIYNYIYRLMGNAEDAEDLTQESFLKAYRALQRGAEIGRLSAWLYRIASNTCMDVLRRRRLIQWRPLGNLLNVFSSGDDPDPEEQIAQREQRAERRTQIEQVLAQLPPRYRMILLLREREGLSYQEIASVTGDSLGTVKITLYRARERARQIGTRLRREAESAPPQPRSERP